MIDTLQEYILTIVSFLRRNVCLICVNLIVIGINLIVGICLSHFRRRAKASRPRPSRQPIKPVAIKRPPKTRRETSINATRQCTPSPPSGLIQHDTTENETLNEVDSFSSNSRSKMAIGEENHGHADILKTNGNIYKRCSNQKLLSRFAAERAGLLNAKVHDGKIKYPNSLRGSEREMHNQKPSSDCRRFSKGSDSGDISITEKSTKSEYQRSQATSLLDRHLRLRKPKQRPKKCSLFVVSGGQGNQMKWKILPDACRVDRHACQQLFDNQSDSTLASKQDSCIWFTADRRSGLGTFSERQRKFKSSDPRVARLAAEIYRQEIMNEVIKRKAQFIKETLACKSGLVESRSQPNIVKNVKQKSHRKSSSKLEQEENADCSKRVLKHSNSEIKTIQSPVAVKSPRRLKTHTSPPDTQSMLVKEQARKVSANKTVTLNAEKRPKCSPDHIFNRTFLKEQSLWPAMNATTGTMNNTCRSQDQTGKGDSAALQLVGMEQRDKNSCEKITRHGNHAFPDMEVQLQHESRRPPSIPLYKRENGSYLAVSPAGQLNDKKPLWITAPGFAPHKSRSRRYLDHRIEEVQKQIGLEVAKTIHNLLFDTEISSSHSTSKKDEHGEYVQSRPLQHCNNSEDERRRSIDTTDAPQPRLFDKVTPARYSPDKVTMSSSLSTRQARDVRGRGKFQMAGRKCRIGAMNECASLDREFQLNRCDHSSSNFMVTELQDQSIPQIYLGNRLRTRSYDFDDIDKEVLAGDSNFACPEESPMDCAPCSDTTNANARCEIQNSKSKHDLRKSTSSQCLTQIGDTSSTTAIGPTITIATATTTASPSSVITNSIPMKYVSAENECMLLEVDSYPNARCVQIANSEDQLESMSLDQQSLLSRADGELSCEAQETGSYNLLLNQWYDDISSTSSDGQGQTCSTASCAH